jgi:glycosyltransferase involved in cell wall biosynthesis
MRLAWFSPMPPVPSGVATVSAELIAALGRDHQIDVYCDDGPLARAPETQSAHNFVWRHRLQPYDLTVYQVGNSSHHDYMWPYLFRYPGLVVLHDAHLHHARAAALLRTKRAGDYRTEFAANEPDANPDVAELAIAGFDNYLYYSWPMRRLVIEASRLTAVHTEALASALRRESPGSVVTSIRLGHGTLVHSDDAHDRRARVRQQYGIPPDAIVFAVSGGLTPDKRIPQVLDAFAAILPYAPNAYLLLAGAPARHYDVTADVRRHGLDSRTTITGYLASDDDVTSHLAACDVSVNMRWPTAREMSGPWLRALAAGRPTIVTDLAHLADLPSLDPRTWRMRPGSGASLSGCGIRGAASDGVRSGGERSGDSDSQPQNPAPDPGSRTPDPGSAARSSADPASRIPHPDSEAPICVAIDILDEDHSLRLAMRRLASDPALRTALGGAGQRYWQREHSIARMVEDYERILIQAASLPVPHCALPAHLVDDGDRLLTRTLGELSVGPVWSRL